jgi:hypothetical protein
MADYVAMNINNEVTDPSQIDETEPACSHVNLETTMGASYNGPFDFEIVGLFQSNNGRKCNLHQICGEHLVAGHIVELIPIKVTIQENESEKVMKVVRIIDNAHRCTVGFVPTVQSKIVANRVQQRKFAIVNDIYKYSLNTYKVSRSERLCGMASCLLTTITNPPPPIIGDDTALCTFFQLI